jgi:hypothetical protein
VYDSGDFSNVADVYTWLAICTKCPAIRFWFPTRTWIRENFKEALLKLNLLPNVVVRRSAMDMNKPAKDHPIDTTSEVHTEGKGCPKQTAGSCAAANCRACWNKDVKKVVYLLHGHKINWKAKMA